MVIYIAVISHGHSDLIHKLSCLPSLKKRFQVVVKSNKPHDHFYDWVSHPNFHWINEQYGKGFGHNNNIVFEYCQSELGMTEEDYFIVLNPDVVIEVKEIEMLINEMIQSNTKLSAINLFKDAKCTIYDNSIRRFPSLAQFCKSFLGLGNTSVLDKSILTTPCKVDWASGSFLAFKVDHYLRIGGFNEYYFMYCEDIDICYRSYIIGEQVTYYPNVKALHLAKHANRKLFSKHFYWHVTSVIRFLLSKAGFMKVKSSITQ